MNKIFAFILALSLMLSVGCTGNVGDFLSQDEAQKIAVEALGAEHGEVSSVHCHVTNTDGKAYYSFYMTCDGKSYEVKIDAISGEIVNKGESAHTH